MTQLEIQTEVYKSSDGRIVYHLDAGRGFVEALLNPEIGRFVIASLDVEPNYRRRGIAKALLRQCLKLAQSAGAQMIDAEILSREALDAFTAVFGQDAVTIQETGTYNPEDDDEDHHTQAGLWFEL